MIGLLALSTALAQQPTTLRTIEHLGDPYTVVTVDLGLADIALYGQGAPRPQTFTAVREQVTAAGGEVLVLMNGGMYRPNHTAVGLHVERGVSHRGLVTSEGPGNFHLLPNGVFAVRADGTPLVVETAHWTLPPSGLQLATQSGPMLVIDGAIHPAFRPQSTSLRRRNGVCASDARTVHFVISDGAVRFHDLATLTRDVLGCRNALYLDGVVSSLWHAEHPESGGRYGAILAVTRKAD